MRFGQFLRDGDVLRILDAAADGNQHLLLGDIDVARLGNHRLDVAPLRRSELPTSDDLSTTDPVRGRAFERFERARTDVDHRAWEMSQRTCVLTCPPNSWRTSFSAALLHAFDDRGRRGRKRQSSLIESPGDRSTPKCACGIKTMLPAGMTLTSALRNHFGVGVGQSVVRDLPDFAVRNAERIAHRVQLRAPTGDDSRRRSAAASILVGGGRLIRLPYRRQRRSCVRCRRRCEPLFQSSFGLQHLDQLVDRSSSRPPSSISAPVAHGGHEVVHTLYLGRGGSASCLRVMPRSDCAERTGISTDATWRMPRMPT